MSQPTATLDPELESLVGLVVEEFQERTRRGEQPDVEDYACRHPPIAAVLRQLLPAVRLLQKPAVGTSLPGDLEGYHIVREVGRGGMGVVYEARHLRLNRTVAVKMVLAGSHATAEDLVRFQAEAEAVAQLQHPNIVQVFETGQHNGLPFFTLEFIAGGSLSASLGGTPLQPARAAPLVETLARAMHYAHQKGIIHRDLKPANILLHRKFEIRNPKPETNPKSEIRMIETPGDPHLGFRNSDLGFVSDFEFRISDFEPKITDFGLAKRVEGGASLTQTGAILGTPSYMAPEQARGQPKEIGPPTDVWALGAILYECLTGRPPFQGPTPTDTLLRVLHDEPVPPRQLQPGVPRDLETICLKCLHKEPPRRYASAEALANDLRRFQAGESIHARPLGPLGRGWRWCRRNPAVATLSALAVALFLAGFAAVAVQWRRAEQNFITAEAQRQRAEHYLEQAEARFGWGQEAIAELLTPIEDLAVPRLDPLHRHLLEKAVRLQQRFLQEKSDDPAARLQTARAHRRLSEVYSRLDQPDQAKPALLAAQELLESAGDDTHARAELVLVYQQLASLHLKGKDHSQAQAYGEKALSLGEQRVADSGGAPAARLQAIASRQLQGDVHHSAGAFALAEKTYRQCLLDLEGVPAGADPAEARRRRARLLNDLGALYWSWYRPAEAEQAYRAAREEWQVLVQDFPRQWFYRQNLAGVWGNLGRLWAPPMMSRPLDALAAHRQALGLWSELVSEFPDVPLYRRQLANAHNGVGSVYYQVNLFPRPVKGVLQHRGPLGGMLASAPAGLLAVLPALALPSEAVPLEEARQAALAARRIDAALDREFPELPAYRYGLAETCNTLGDVLLVLGDYVEAERVLIQAEELFADLAARFPSEGDYHSGRAMALTMRGGGRWRQKRLDEARALLERGLPHHQAALARNPVHGIYQERMGTHFRYLAVVRMGLKDHAGAAAAVEQRMHYSPPRDSDAYESSLILALCRSLAEKDESRPETERHELADKYADRAVELLRESVKLNKGNPGLLTGIQTNPNFKPLQSRADFQKLLEEVKAKAPAEP
jgi:serine/threonine protein kinase